MKLRTLSIFGAALIVSLTACGGDDAEETDGAAVDTTTVAPAPLPAPLPAAPTDSAALPPTDTMAHDSMSHDSTMQHDTTKKM